MADRVASLFADHAEELRAHLARRLGDRQIAVDLLQELFVRFSEKTENCIPENARAYLYKMATNLAIDHERHAARTRHFMNMEACLADVADDRPGAAEIMEARDRLARVQAAIAQLPILTREIFRLNRIEGLSYNEVAWKLSVSQSSVQKHLARALAHALAASETGFANGITDSSANHILSLRAGSKGGRRPTVS